VDNQKERARGQFDRGWRQAEAEIAAAIGCGDYTTLHRGKLWAEKMEARLQSEYERGRRELTEEIFTAIRHFLPLDAEKRFCQEFGIENGDARP
jgi:hypothetical protein